MICFVLLRVNNDFLILPQATTNYGKRTFLITCSVAGLFNNLAPNNIKKTINIIFKVHNLHKFDMLVLSIVK